MGRRELFEKLEQASIAADEALKLAADAAAAESATHAGAHALVSIAASLREIAVAVRWAAVSQFERDDRGREEEDRPIPPPLTPTPTPTPGGG